MSTIFGGASFTGKGTVQATPASGAVLADSGQITDTGFYDVRVVVSSDNNNRVRLEYRNAANSSTTDAYPMYVGANGPCEFLLRLPVSNVNERFRVAVDSAGAASGNIVAHIQVNRVG